MAKKVVLKSGGITWLGLLAIVFIVLKLTGAINWSWWWVLAPLYGGSAIMVAVILICVIIFRLFDLYELAKK